MRVKILLLLSVFLLAGCSGQKEPPVKIVANSWIGYSPLFYAKEKGWLEEINVKLSTVVSLGESMMTFKTGGFEGITGTQYEYKKLLSQKNEMIPIIMFDRSNGGDMVMGNRSMEAFQNSTQPIDVYLEIDSINYLMFKDFVKSKNLEEKKFNFINKDQLKIVTTIKNNKTTNPTLITTYTPYNFELEQHNFTVLASTKDITDITVLDALYVTKSSLEANQNTYLKLKKVINQALTDLEKDPKNYYNLVKFYIENPSYEEFSSSLNDIEWITTAIPKSIALKMKQLDFPGKDLM